jgi:hypothetical protein
MVKIEKLLPLLNNTTAKVNFQKLVFIIIIGMIFFFIPKAYLGDTFPLCLYRILFNKKCIGCGATRAVWSILHLKFIEAFEYNKLIIIIFPLLTACIIKWILKKKPTTLYFSKEK